MWKSFQHPLIRADQASKETGCEILVMDDGAIGGSHARKMPHLFGAMHLARKKRFVALGGIGSNYCLAAARYGFYKGIPVTCLMISQPETPATQRVPDLCREEYGAEVIIGSRFKGLPGILLAAPKLAKVLMRGDCYCPPPGGATPAAVECYARAAMELPFEPDAIFVAASSCGTAAGLLRGSWGKTQVHAVKCAEIYACNARKIRRLAGVRGDKLVLHTKYLGKCYGDPVELPDDSPVPLDPVYTGKAWRAMKDWCRENPGKKVVFWNTYGSIHR